MEGYGEWVQLSVFQCRLTAKQRVEMVAALDAVIHHDEDHVKIVDLGPANKLSLRIVSLAKRFEAITHEPIIVWAHPAVKRRPAQIWFAATPRALQYWLSGW